jgi:outer membrane receptor protein involved in Fe transport
MLFFGSILAASLSAQTVVPPTADTQTPPPTTARMTPTTVSVASGTSEEEVVKLSPFEVSTTRNVGYQATDTLAGTRIRTDLKDVGASIAVLTQEFLNDIGATDNSTLLQYTTNAEVAGTRGTYAGLGNGTSVDESGNLRSPEGAQRVRGLAAADNARDFYITDIPWDSFNVDRIDILRGPNSILYGLGSPAGIVNGSTRNAAFQNRGEVTARLGS